MSYIQSAKAEDQNYQQTMAMVSQVSKQPPDIAPTLNELRKSQEEKKILSLRATLQGVSIGAAAAVTGEVSVQLSDGSWRKIESGSIIQSYARIKTGSKGRMQVLLLDETVFTIGPDTDLILDDFVYDPFTPEGIFTATMAKGIIRYISGKVARKQPKDMKIKTPVDAVGTRGTEFIVEYDEGTNTSTWYLNEGEIEITPVATGEITVFSARRMIVVDATGIVEDKPLSKKQWKKALKAAELD